MASKRGFKITGSKGFHITFENGVTVSVQFGGGSYSQHHNDIDLIGKERDVPGGLDSGDAEIAIWKDGGEWITADFSGRPDQEVLGWQSPAEVLAAMNWAATQ